MVKKELDPLIPLDDLKSVLRGLVAAPKRKIVKASKPRPKRNATKKR